MRLVAILSNKLNYYIKLLLRRSMLSHKRFKSMNIINNGDISTDSNLNDGSPKLDYRKIIHDAVHSSEESVSFVVNSEIPSVLGLPRLSIEGVGRIGFPLSASQAKDIISKSSLAPFGLGQETLLDTNVREVWQINKDQINLDDRWSLKTLPFLVKDVAIKLGIESHIHVEAHLYKLLLYEEGGHFQSHKEAGMFGTLLIQLPAEHEGGELVIQFGSESRQISLSEDSADKCYYAAFYADCDHTFKPVTKGLRLVLAYNLVRSTSTATHILPKIKKLEYLQSQLGNKM